MNAPVLDTLRCAQTLRTAGFPEEQAEAMAQVLGDALTDVATKTDLDNAIGGLKTELKADIAQLDTKIDALETKIVTTTSALDTKIVTTAGALDAKIGALETKIVTVTGGLETKIVTVTGGLETKIVTVTGGLETKIGSLSDQLKHHIRVTYAVGGILVTLLLGNLVAPHLSWGAPATAPPNSTESPAAEDNSVPAQTSTEAQTLVKPTEAPTPPPIPRHANISSYTP